MNSYNEVQARCESYLEAIKNIKMAKEAAEKFPEYPEHVALILEIDELIDGLKTRLLSFSKTEDKGMMTRIHQIDVVMGG